MVKEFNEISALNNLISIVKKNNKNAKISVIKKAFNFSIQNHEGQKRLSGEPYFIHPYSVALTLAEYGLDTETICSALLHDVLEDTDASRPKLMKEFGKKIYLIVRSLTKFQMIVGKSKKQRNNEYLQKILLSTAYDVRTIIVKIADKLHNLRTSQFLTKKKQKKLAQEVLDIYVPLAHKLGIHVMKHELADLAFPIFKPKLYQDIERKIIVQVHKDEKDFLIAAEQVKKTALKHKIDAFAYLRHKSPYTICRKMERRIKSFDEIYDYLLISVLVDSIPECYEMLGIIHDLFNPVPLKLKDYIAIPEPNLYRAIHTTVLTKKGKKIKFYITTRKMSETNKLGIISLLKEKASKKELKNKIGFIEKLSKLDNKTIRNPQFLKILKTDFLSTSMFVFSPHGEVIELRSDSNPLDFAYHYEPKKANFAKKALVNGKLVPLSYTLFPGDMVEIIPAKTKQVSKKWLKIVKGITAKEKIKEALKRKN